MNQRKDYTSLLGVRAGKEQKLICTRWSYRVCVLGYMPMSACLCVSFHVSAWWMCVCIYVCVLIWAHVCEYIPMCVCVCVSISGVFMCTCFCVVHLCVPVCTLVFMAASMCLCVLYVCSRVYLHVFSLYVYVLVYMGLNTVCVLV